MTDEDKYVYTCYHNGMKTQKEVDFDSTWMHQLEEFMFFLNGCGYSIDSRAIEAAIDTAKEVNMQQRGW